MINHYFSSDTHFFHGNILKYSKRIKYLTDTERLKLDRGDIFSVSRESVERMNNDLIDQINTVVTPDDHYWHLGDFLFSRFDVYGETKKILDKINTKNVHLIFGNHDDKQSCWPDLFKTIDELKEISINPSTGELTGKFQRGWRNIVLCHYGMAFWNGSHKGAWQLYGHTHSDKEEWMDQMMPWRKSIDVGVDNAFKLFGEYRPFSFKDLEEIFKNKTGKVISHHKIWPGKVQEQL